MLKRNDWAVVFDKDGTLTPKEPGALVQIVDHAALSPEARDVQQGIRDRYLERAKSGALTPLEEQEWLESTFDAYIEHKLTRAAWQAALDRVVLRPGVVETLSALRAAHIPMAIISYGCADFVEYVLERHGLSVDMVYATRMRHEDGVVVSYDTGTTVVPEDKGRWSRHFADTHGVEYDRVIAVGDSGGDRKLGHRRELRVVIAGTEKEAEKYRAMTEIGHVFLTDAFDPVTEFLKRTIGLSF